MINLNDLIAKNNFDEIEAFIKKTKKEKGWEWCYASNNSISDACRDAVLLGHERIVQLFLDEGLSADTYAHSSGNSGCICPLKYFAAKVGNLSIVKLLVSKGAEIKDTRNFSDERDNQDAMRAAIKKGHLDVVQYLLENGGSANGTFGGMMGRQTFLGKAASAGNKPLVDLLVKHGAKIENALSLNNQKFRERYNSYDRAVSNYSDSSREREQKYSSKTEMEKWDKEKLELIEGRDDRLKKYSNSVQMLLDHAIGVNLDKEISGYFGGSCGGLTFLQDLDVTGFNFVGVAVDGQPITLKMLVEKKLKGADKAFITHNDIIKIEDEERRNALLARLEAMLKSQGKIISQDGIYNLVPLANAAEKGLIDVVLVRLLAGVDPNEKTTDVLNTRLAIVAAAKNGFSDVVKLLAEHPKIDQKSRLTAAQEAKKNGHEEISKYLGSLMDVNEKDPKGDTLLHKAVEANDIAEIKRLLGRGADINLENGQGLTPLKIAASNVASIEYGKEASKEGLTLIKFLLSNGADPNKYKWDYSPLRAAANAGSAKAVELLLPVTEKRDLKETHGYGDNKVEKSIPWYAPLMFDSYGSGEWLEILTLLKKHGADLNAVHGHGEETILHRFIRGFPSFSDIRRTMRDLKMSIRGCEDRLGPNPLQKDYQLLIKNAKERFTKVFKQLNFLLENGADPRIACGRHEENPLHILIEKIDLSFIDGATEHVIERFLKCGVNVNSPDAYGFTPLHKAAKTGDITSAAYLVKNGADIRVKTKQGHTPLHLAAAGNPQTTKFLIGVGADVIYALDEKGRTPLVYSEQACIDNNKIYMYPSAERDEPYLQAQRVLKYGIGKPPTYQDSFKSPGMADTNPPGGPALGEKLFSFDELMAAVIGDPPPYEMKDDSE